MEFLLGFVSAIVLEIVGFFVAALVVAIRRVKNGDN